MPRDRTNYGTAIGGAGGSGITQLPPAVTPVGGSGGASASSPLTLTAQTNPALDALLATNNKYIRDLQSGTGLAMDIAGQKMRDAAEGSKAALGQSEGFRGVRSSNRMAGLEADTNRNVTQAIGNVAAERERMLGGAIQGSLGIARAPAEMALAEKGLGLNAFQAQKQAEQQDFGAFLALLNAKRESPIYSGGGGSHGRAAGSIYTGGR